MRIYLPTIFPLYSWDSLFGVLITALLMILASDVQCATPNPLTEYLAGLEDLVAYGSKDSYLKGSGHKVYIIRDLEVVLSLRVSIFYLEPPMCFLLGFVGLITSIPEGPVTEIFGLQVPNTI